MSTESKYNLKNPGKYNERKPKEYHVNSSYLGVKRIMREARELALENTYEYDAHPLEVRLLKEFFFSELCINVYI